MGRPTETTSSPRPAAREHGGPEGTSGTIALSELVRDLPDDVADRLREPAQQAAASVKGAATDAVSNVKDESVSARDDVQGQVRDSAGTVKNSTTT